MLDAALFYKTTGGKTEKISGEHCMINMSVLSTLADSFLFFEV